MTGPANTARAQAVTMRILTSFIVLRLLRTLTEPIFSPHSAGLWRLLDRPPKEPDWGQIRQGEQGLSTRKLRGGGGGAGCGGHARCRAAKRVPEDLPWADADGAGVLRHRANGGGCKPFRHRAFWSGGDAVLSPPIGRDDRGRDGDLQNGAGGETDL